MTKWLAGIGLVVIVFTVLSPQTADPGQSSELLRLSEADYAAALHEAVNDRNTLQLKALLNQENGLIKAEIINNSLLLHLAAMEGDIEAISLLLNLGGNWGQVDINGRTPLMVAILSRQERATETLLEAWIKLAASNPQAVQWLAVRDNQNLTAQKHALAAGEPYSRYFRALLP